jgi:hypothetical protein
MDEKLRLELADLLTALSDDALEEEVFRSRLLALAEGGKDPMLELAQDEADEYFRLFHRTNLLGRRVSPDPYELGSGRDSLRTIARALREEWPLDKTKKALRWI